MRRPDPIEREFLRAIDQAVYFGDNDRAFDLSNGLTEYRRFYKDYE